MARNRRLGLTTALLVLLAGCASSFVRHPIVTLETVHLAGLGLRGGTLVVNLHIDNPNRFALNTNLVRYHLDIAEVSTSTDTTWAELASGIHTEQISVGGRQSTAVQLPVDFTYTGLGSATSALLREGAVSYRATGYLDVTTPMGPYQVPFSRGGVVSMLPSL